MNAVNYGLLEALGPGAILKIDQAFTNYGSIFTTNGGVLQIAGLANTTNLVINNSTGIFGNIQNSGSILVTNGTLNVTGTLSNSGGGSLVVMNGTLNAGNVFGGFLLDPSTGHIANLTLTPGASFSLIVTPGSTLYVGGTFDNQLTNRVTEGSDTNVAQEYSFQGGFIFTNAVPAAAVATQNVEIASVRTDDAHMFTTNFAFGTFQVGDPTTGNNAYVRLVNNRTNAPADAPLSANEMFVASNLIVALAGSILDWNNQSGYVANLSNSGTMVWTNAGNPAGVVLRLDVVNTFTNQGGMTVGNGTVLQLSNDFINASSGVLHLFNGGVLTNFVVGTVLTNAGTIDGDGLVVPKIANNAGGVVAANTGTLVVGGGIANNINYGTLGTTNAGTLAINNATLTNAAGATIGLQGGTFRMTGSGSNVVNQGTIMGYGTAAGVIDNQVGATILATGGVLNLTAGITNSVGAAVNAGLLEAMGASAVLNVGQSFTNAGTIALGGGMMTAPSVSNAGGIRGYGTLNAALSNLGTVTNNTGGQTLTFAQPVNNAAAGMIAALNGSSLTFSNAVLNSGTLTVQDQSTATFVGSVTNSGTMTVQNQSLFRFNAGLTNNGTLAFGSAVNPSTTIISGSLTLGAGGIIAMGSLTNNQLVVQGNFVNGSTNNNSYDTAKGITVFGAAGGLATNTFEVAGLNKGTNYIGFMSNFAVGTLNITNGIRFVDYINNGGGGNSNEVLYVDVLHLFNGATMKLSALTIYVGLEFIYEDGSGTKTFNNVIINQVNSATLGLVNVSIDNGGQIVFVPEPSTYALMGLGLAALAGWRRWRKPGRRS